MELKEYQERTLNTFTRWLSALEKAQSNADAAIAALQGVGADIPIPDDIRNYPKAAWQALADVGEIASTAGEYVSRTDGANRPIPHVCFKVPTGGGKTLLAAAALERLNRPTGLTLWIVPTKAIYAQTKDALWNRDHPYRQMLERASGGRVKLLEKDEPFTRADIENYLCVMLLMLPAANRQKGKEFLRMFRDSGRYPTLFPDSDDALGDGRLLGQYPDLDRTHMLERMLGRGPVKHSLFNVFKMLRPVVVLDEAHKAYGARKRESNQEFAESINRLNPSLVIELSATPNRGISNLLVDISGVDLKDEEMIKLPVQITSFTNVDWHHTLEQAHDKLEKLATEAESFQHSTNRYIRPIAVVRTERTGRDQRDGERIHSEDVREYLVQNLGVPAEAVRVKTSDNDELGREDLLSPLSQVRWIITKSALMEGWDCPFAYLLVMLDNTRAQNAITQLVGRVMRQPYAERTERDALDQCYVYCHDTDVGKAVSQVKNGLEKEGLTGLGNDVWSSQSEDVKRVTLRRRKPYSNQEIFLPLVLHKEDTGWVELDYQRHILPSIDWDSIDAPAPQASLPDQARRQTASVDVGDNLPVYHSDNDVYVDKSLRISWFARRLADVVPNPWQSARIVGDMAENLRANDYTDDKIHDTRSFLSAHLREHVAKAVEQQAEQIFKRKLGSGEIRFDLETNTPNYRMAQTYEIPVAQNDAPLGNYGEPTQLNLFEPMFAHQFDSDLERKFAFYLEEQKALRWWHRVAVRQQGEYYLRGWGRERIFPDFVAMGGEVKGKPQLLIFETKGENLRGNNDTDYKQRVFETLEGAFNSAGTIRIAEGPAKGVFRLVFTKTDIAEAMSKLQGAYSP